MLPPAQPPVCLLQAALLLALLHLPLPAQSLKFEVASVKRGRPDAGYSGGCHGIDSTYAAGEASSAPPLGRCVINDARLSHMLGIAFGLRSMATLKGGPSWAKSGDIRFNIEAKAEDPKATEDQLFRMLQALLIERFSLQFHREIVDAPGFALVVAKNGPKLALSKESGEPEIHYSPSFKPAEGQPIAATARNYSMAMLASALTVLVQPRPVNDETGLTGRYDFKLSWDETNGPSLVTALQEQLGVRLEPRKVPVSLFVIDSAQMPTEN